MLFAHVLGIPAPGYRGASLCCPYTPAPEILVLTMAKCSASAGKSYKKTMRGKKGKTKIWKKVSAEELRPVKMWYKEDGRASAEIARLLHRDTATISRRLHNKVSAEQQGAKRVLTLAHVDRLIAKKKVYIKQAKGRYCPFPSSHDRHTIASRLPHDCHMIATRLPLVIYT